MYPTYKLNTQVPTRKGTHLSSTHMHVAKAAKLLDLDARLLAQQCGNAEVPGARMASDGTWLVPKEWVRERRRGWSKQIKWLGGIAAMVVFSFSSRALPCSWVLV